jgi:hypothetical protein
MASSKRQFDNFNIFPGSVNAAGIYVFPELIHKDSHNNTRKWKISIRLIKTDKDQINKIDWNLLTETQIPIKKEYYGHNKSYVDLPKSTAAQLWSETGVIDGKITRSNPTYFTKIANEGKINQRHEFHQALISARSLWLKRKDKGCRSNKDVDVKDNNLTLYYPMLAKPWKDGEKHLKFPLYVQPKLDGVRCLVFIPSYNCGYEKIIIYSRTLKEYPNYNYIKIALYSCLNQLFDQENNQSIYLDGELYKHGKKLQDISGDSRSSKSKVSDKKNKKIKNFIGMPDEYNEYHIYDCFYPKELNIPYSERKDQISELFNGISKNIINILGVSSSDIIKPVKTTYVKSLVDAKKIFNKLVNNGYEGIILRNTEGIYLANSKKTGAFMRSKNLVKMKIKYSDEFEIVGFTEGTKGKDKGAIIWIAKIKDETKDKTFNITPKDMTYDERYKLFIDAQDNFNKKYLGRMMTVEYEDLSKGGIPLRAKACSFRDYE